MFDLLLALACAFFCSAANARVCVQSGSMSQAPQETMSPTGSKASEEVPPATRSVGPGGRPRPAIPSAQRGGKEEPPPGAELVRNGALADRFTAAGQKVSYTLACEEGEVVLLDLELWGYARAWECTALVRILDKRGGALVESRRAAGSHDRLFLYFRTPSQGNYACEMEAEGEGFRYILTRHSNYTFRGPGSVEAVQESGRVHGYLASSDESAAYALELNRGERVAIRVQNSEEEGLAEFRALRHSPEETPDPIYPRFVLRIESGRRVVQRGSHFYFFEAPSDGTYRIVVEKSSPSPPFGGLFDLDVNLHPEPVRVEGVVVSEEDEPYADVSLRFWREPDGDDLGEVKTDSQGRFEHLVLPGPYTVELSRRWKDGEKKRDFSVNILRSRELNAVF